MAMTLQQLIDTACFLGGTEGANKDTIAEILVPRVFYMVCRRAARDPMRRNLVTVTNTITLASGSVALADTIMCEYMRLAAVEDPAVATTANKMRWIEKWSEFVRPLDNSLGYFTTVQASGANKFFMTLPGASYSTGAGYSGSIKVTIPTVTSVPTSGSGAIAAQGEIIDDFVTYLTAALNGNWAELIKGDTAVEQALRATQIPKPEKIL